MSKSINIANVVAQPRVEVESVRGNLVRFTVFDGNNEAVLVMPRSNARTIASTLNGIIRAQTFDELVAGERAGTLTDKQAKKLRDMRDSDERIRELNAERSAKAAERRAEKALAAADPTGEVPFEQPAPAQTGKRGRQPLRDVAA